jgi:hypothetical protein
MIDTGLTDTAGQVAFDLHPALFDLLDQSGRLLAAGIRRRRDASGRNVRLRAAFVAAELLDPTTGVSVGPRIQCMAVRNYANAPSRVGVVFFHRLTGCRVVWELDTRTWCVEYP